MKPLATLISSISLICISQKLLAQVHGPGIVFTYDAAGKRIRREYDPNALIAPKKGSTFPIDTLTQNIDNSNFRLTAYPNPTTDVVIVNNQTWVSGDNAVVELFDIAGKFISRNQFSNARGEITLGGLTPGTYQVHYYLNGNLKTTWKIVKL